MHRIHNLLVQDLKVGTTGAVPAMKSEATDRCQNLRRKMADCPS